MEAKIARSACTVPRGFAQRVAIQPRSAKGAKYDSQGQAASAARRVALDHNQVDYEALKERNTTDDISHFQCSLDLYPITRGDASRCARRLPLAFTFRGFGAQNRA